MKKSILLFSLLVVHLCMAQIQDAKTENNIRVILNDDGTWSYAKENNSENAIVLGKLTQWVNPDLDILKDVGNETYSIHKFINLNNGLEKSVTVKLLWQFGLTVPEAHLPTINLIILQAYTASKVFCKTPESYVPIGLFISRVGEFEKGVWKLHSKFKGKNDYGKVGEFDKFFYYDADGKIIKP